MTKQRILTLLAAVAALIGGPASAATAAKPNIVVLLVDDMGWASIGCYGGMVETPNLDRLAADGVRFSPFYNAARGCPSRASIMTGLHPHETGFGHMNFGGRDKQPVQLAERTALPAAYRGWLDSAVPTLPEMLKAAGYSAYMTGTWHLGNSNPDTWPTQRGFDRFCGFLSGTSDYFRPDLLRGNTSIKPAGERYYTTDGFTDEAIQFLKEHEEAKDPELFFLYLSYNAPHFPLQAMPEDFRKYRGRFKEGWDVLRERIIARQKQMGLIPEDTALAPRPGPHKNRLGIEGGPVPAWDSLSPQQQDAMDAIMATYAGMVDRVDQNVGKLVAHLRDTGALENTLIFFLSDNGAEAESPALGNCEFEKLGQYGNNSRKSHYGRAGVLPWDEAMDYSVYGGKDWAQRTREWLKKEVSSKGKDLP
jgi:arylsulfatase